FLRMSGIPDARKRIDAGRHEAESMSLDGYVPVDVVPFEAASGSKAVACPVAVGCTASLRFDGSAGWYEIRVRYFDQNNGASRFRLFVNDQKIDEWRADDNIPTRKIDAHSATRRVVSGVALRRGDVVRVEGVPHLNEPAGLDYIEIVAALRID